MESAGKFPMKRLSERRRRRGGVDDCKRLAGAGIDERPRQRMETNATRAGNGAEAGRRQATCTRTKRAPRGEHPSTKHVKARAGAHALPTGPPRRRAADRRPEEALHPVAHACTPGTAARGHRPHRGPHGAGTSTSHTGHALSTGRTAAPGRTQAPGQASAPGRTPAPGRTSAPGRTPAPRTHASPRTHAASCRMRTGT
eukprot:4487608-Pleurochrysis_carterae.AAC.1